VSNFVQLTRGDTGGLFNIAQEMDWDGQSGSSPIGTFWSNIPSTDIDDFSSFEFQGCPDQDCNYLIGKTITAMVPDVNETRFYDVTFNDWTVSGGGFAYTRTLTYVCSQGERLWCLFTFGVFVYDCQNELVTSSYYPLKARIEALIY
jgi:hypothetical protein